MSSNIDLMHIKHHLTSEEAHKSTVKVFSGCYYDRPLRGTFFKTSPVVFHWRKKVVKVWMARGRVNNDSVWVKRRVAFAPDGCCTDGAALIRSASVSSLSPAQENTKKEGLGGRLQQLRACVCVCVSSLCVPLPLFGTYHSVSPIRCRSTESEAVPPTGPSHTAGPLVDVTWCCSMTPFRTDTCYRECDDITKRMCMMTSQNRELTIYCIPSTRFFKTRHYCALSISAQSLHTPNFTVIIVNLSSVSTYYS